MQISSNLKFFIKQSAQLELLKISVFCQRRKENINLKKYSHCGTKSLFEKRRATVSLPTLVCLFAVVDQTCAKKRASVYSSQLSFCFKWATFVKNQEIVQNSARNCKFTKMGLLDQKRADVLKFAIFVQNSVHNNEMLESGVFCVKGQQNNNLTKYSHSFT